VRRPTISVTLILVAIGLWVSTAQASAPTLGAVSVTDIQGVSALLVGTVNPGGEASSYRFEYGSQGPCDANPCASTTLTPLGSANTDRPARVTIAGLSPDTPYNYRLIATNATATVVGNAGNGGAGSFTTTHGFGFLPALAGFSAEVLAADGAPAALAGSHPYRLDLGLGFNQGGEAEGQPGVPFPDANLRNLAIDLPPGLLLNPKVLDRCGLADFHKQRNSPFQVSLSGESCPVRTQAGTLQLKSTRAGGAPRRFGLFNLDPPPGVMAQLGASPFGTPLVFDVRIETNAAGSYTLSLRATDLPQSLNLTGLDLSLWGVPWAASHDAQRGNCLNEAEPSFPWCKHSVGDAGQNSSATPLAYLTLPTSCQGALAFSATVNSWQQPAALSAGALNRDPGGQPVDQQGCQSFSFGPVTSGFLTDTTASSPSGYNFRLSNDNPQLTIPNQQLPSQSRNAVVTLPSEVTINPSLGAGLIGCEPAQYASEDAFNPQGTGCPNGAKIGDFSVHSPLIDELIDGAIYLASPDDPNTPAPGQENPFDTLIAVYLIAKSPERGILVKVPGKLVPDLRTGNLIATFEDLPQLPYTDLNVDFRSGQRAPLITPSSCGPATSTIDLVPWSGPGAKHTTTASAISSGIGGGPCPTGATAPFNPGVVAGGVNSNVNSYTPYFVHLSRKDTEQEFTSYSLILPKGITGKLAGIPFCPDAALAAKIPTCPAASLVGHVVSAYGIGFALTYASGKMYMAGPYNGAPISLVALNSAKVGPFDLGTIATRFAFQVDPKTAQLRLDASASDPIPHIIKGIPIHLRDIRVYIDRPGFTHNPSSCEASKLESALTGSGLRFDDRSDDSHATVTAHFQLLNCLTLGFKPKLGLRLRGGTKQGSYPQLRATFASRGPLDSNLKDMAVVIPHQMFVAQEHIRGICTRPQFAADACPANTVYGKAVAYTPLFDQPLTGNVYLRSNPSRSLPDLVTSLHAGAIRIVVDGMLESAKNGGVLTRFTDLPDAPIDRFVMTLNGGKRGLLVNSANVCQTPPVASVKALAQNNIGAVFTTKLRGKCKGKGGAGKTHKGGSRR
jgi:hypothetical protein